MKRLIATIIFCTALSGCGSDPAATLPAATSTGATPATAVPAAGSPEGTWTTQPFGHDAIAGTLDAAGLGEHTEQFFTIDETPDDLVIKLRLEAGAWTAYRSAGTDSTVSLHDRGTYATEGDTLLYRPFSGGLNTYRWSVAGDQLSLTFVSTTEPSYAGLPNEVFQRAFYTTVPFGWTPR